MPRFVILEHDAPLGVHWDFMLEMGDALATWALAEPPNAAKPVAAEALPDHRLAYLDYEGPISSGRGAVTRWDAGTFQIERNSPTSLVVTLSGAILSGRATLERTDRARGEWTLKLGKEEG
jgi:hypothetical protein